MDKEVKQLLHSICAILHDVTEQAYHAHKLSEAAYLAATGQPASALNDGHIVRSKQQIQDALAKVVRQLEQ